MTFGICISAAVFLLFCYCLRLSSQLRKLRREFMVDRLDSLAAFKSLVFLCKLRDAGMRQYVRQAIRDFYGNLQKYELEPLQHGVSAVRPGPIELKVQVVIEEPNDEPTCNGRGRPRSHVHNPETD